MREAPRLLMTGRTQVALLPDGRLHLHDGPIDLIIEAWGEAACVRLAYDAARAAFDGLLDRLCAELATLRAPARADGTLLRGSTALRMYDAVAPFASDMFITPMAAVAGSVADTVLAAMLQAAPHLTRACVNNGGDIAVHLGPGEHFTIGLVDRPDRPAIFARAEISADDGVGGVATSGARGRSFSLGIADAVTVLARNSAQADAAATVIANAVDLPDNPTILRTPARELQPDSDLQDLLVTRFVPRLSEDDIARALECGLMKARELVSRGLISAASLHLQGQTLTTRDDACSAIASRKLEPMLTGESYV
jgi:ApbE superfamily uncharacterized protein (UPF0280 family)